MVTLNIAKEPLCRAAGMRGFMGSTSTKVQVIEPSAAKRQVENDMAMSFPGRMVAGCIPRLSNVQKQSCLLLFVQDLIDAKSRAVVKSEGTSATTRMTF